MFPLLALAAVIVGAGVGLGLMPLALSFGARPDSTLGFMVPTTAVGDALTLVASLFLFLGVSGAIALLLMPFLAIGYWLTRPIDGPRGASIRQPR